MRRSVAFLAALAAALFAAAAPAQVFSNSRLVRCESVNSREVTCRIPAGQLAEFVSQESRADCVRGRTYFIDREAIVVTQGCRATFRLVDDVYGGDGMRAELRTRLAVELGRMIRDDHRLGSTPVVTIVTDNDRAAPNGQVTYDGTARVERAGSFWNTISFDANWDPRSRAFTRIDYDLSGGATSFEHMDSRVRAEIERALADEVRRQKGGGVAQTAVNWRHRSTRSGGTDIVTGKFGYSWNDGEWVTRGFEAQLNPSGQQVRSVRIWRLDGQ